MSRPLGDGSFYRLSALLVDCRLYPGRKERLPIIVLEYPDGSQKEILENFPCEQGNETISACRQCFKEAIARLSRPAAP